jgi:3-hydroxyisobutyrate dehydrogenase-like beta-hydroxyacid dehydrogenase
MTTSAPASPRMGWIGLGSMGLAMATNLQNHLSRNDLPPLRYWNRTAARGEPLRALGGVACANVRELAAECDVIWVSVRLSIIYVQ